MRFSVWSGYGVTLSHRPVDVPSPDNIFSGGLQCVVGYISVPIVWSTTTLQPGVWIIFPVFLSKPSPSRNIYVDLFLLLALF